MTGSNNFLPAFSRLLPGLKPVGSDLQNFFPGAPPLMGAPRDEVSHSTRIKEKTFNCPGESPWLESEFLNAQPTKENAQ